jgi:hypothetical protein
MQRSNHRKEGVALILAAALCAFTPGLAAQTQSGSNAQQEQPQQNQQQAFKGKIVKLQSGQYALVTGQTPEGKVAGHFLDDQDNAKKYEDKQVTVTGTFDTASNMIHVSNIQAA